MTREEKHAALAQIDAQEDAVWAQVFTFNIPTYVFDPGQQEQIDSLRARWCEVYDTPTTD